MDDFWKAVNLIVILFLSVTLALSHPSKTTTMNHDAQAFNDYASAAVDLGSAHVDQTGLFISMYCTRFFAGSVGIFAF